jgi:hypothetical protein
VSFHLTLYFDICRLVTLYLAPALSHLHIKRVSYAYRERDVVLLYQRVRGVSSGLILHAFTPRGVSSVSILCFYLLLERKIEECFRLQLVENVMVDPKPNGLSKHGKRLSRSLTCRQ